MEIIREMIFSKDIFLFSAGSSLILADFSFDFDSAWPIISGFIFLAVWIWRQVREDHRKEIQHDDDERRARNEEKRRQQAHDKDMKE
jgi:hypothetical protein